MTEVDRATWAEIEREIREGTPDTPERIAMFKRADEIYKRMTDENISKRIVELREIAYQKDCTEGQAVRLRLRLALAQILNRHEMHRDTADQAALATAMKDIAWKALFPDE